MGLWWTTAESPEPPTDGTHRHCALPQCLSVSAFSLSPGKLLRLRMQSILSAPRPWLFAVSPRDCMSDQQWQRGEREGFSPSERAPPTSGDPCLRGLWCHGRWSEEHSVSHPRDTEAPMTEPAELESVQTQSRLLFAHCLPTPPLRSFPPTFPKRSRTQRHPLGYAR